MTKPSIIGVSGRSEKKKLLREKNFLTWTTIFFLKFLQNKIRQKLDTKTKILTCQLPLRIILVWMENIDNTLYNIMITCSTMKSDEYISQNT